MALWEKNVSLKYAKKYLGEDGKDLAKNFAEFARKHKKAHQKVLLTEPLQKVQNLDQLQF